MSSNSPVVARLELTARLRQRREQLDITTSTVAKTLGFSRNYWSAVENDRTSLSADKLQGLFDLFEFDQEDQIKLAALHDAGRSQGWWQPYDVLSDEERRFYGLEAGALLSRTFDVLLMPDLLQTPEYARVLIGSSPFASPFNLDRLVDVRLQRQSRLNSGDDCLKLTAVVSEASLFQQVGGLGCLRRQLEHIENQVRSLPSTLDIRVLPFTAPPQALWTSSSIAILDFESSYLSPMIWQSGANDLIYDSDTITQFQFAFDTTLEMALSRENSLDVIRKRIAELQEAVQ